MTDKTALTLQIFEKLGAPLMAAVASVAAQQGKETLFEAGSFATLFSRAVQTGVALADMMDLRDADGQAEQVRIALAAIGAPMLAACYQEAGRMPEEAEIKRLVSAFSAILSFADQGAQRLSTLTPAMDEHHYTLQYMAALAPVIAAVTNYSFGRPSSKLAQDVADRLSRKAASLCETLLGDARDSQAELYILRSLAQLYVEIHETQARALEGAAESDGLPALEPLWQRFDEAAALLLALSRNSAPAEAETVREAPLLRAPLRQDNHPLSFFRGNQDEEAV